MNKRVIHKIIKKAVAGAVTLSLILSLPAYSVANADTLSDLQDRFKSLQTQQQQIQTKINDLKSKVSTAKEKRDAINASVKVLNEQIELLDNQIETLNSQIKTTNENIEKTQKEIDEETEKYKERVCTIYEVGNFSKLEVLLTSNDLSDFFVKYDTIKTVSEYDKKLKADLTSNRDKLQSQKESLDAQLASLQESKGVIAAKKSLKNIQLDDAKKAVDGLQQDKQEMEEKISSVEEKARETDEQIDKEIARLAEIKRRQLAGSGGSSSVSNSDIVNYARQFNGTRYVFGCANPSYGLDCSGLVQYVFAKTKGINLPHKASIMATMGTAVSRDNLQPGDVVFFRIQHSYVDHCGIYTGNGNFIAANSGSRKCVYEDELFTSRYWSRYYVGARRYS